MGDTSGWVPCAHEWVDGSDGHVCSLCGDSLWEHASRGGWRYVETNIDSIDGMVRFTVIDSESRRIIYSARYTPDIAREVAYSLTIKALELEDG